MPRREGEGRNRRGFNHILPKIKINNKVEVAQEWNHMYSPSLARKAPAVLDA